MFNEKLKRLMDENGWNVTAVSDMTGIGKSSISQYLSGKVKCPDKKQAQIALALGKDADYFRVAEIDTAIAGGYRLQPKTAAQLMGISRETLYQGLRDGRFPFGYAVKNASGLWTYWISAIKFTEETGIPVPAR